jgi:hypothetical protein
VTLLARMADGCAVLGLGRWNAPRASLDGRALAPSPMAATLKPLVADLT